MCLSWCSGSSSGLLARESGLDWLEAMLGDRSVRLVGHHVAFDLAVALAARPALAPQIFEALSEDRVVDTRIREQLFDIALGSLRLRAKLSLAERVGCYSLAGLVYSYCGTDLSASKAGGWRLRFAELDGIPIERWPPEAAQYAEDDARWTWEVHARQAKRDVRLAADVVSALLSSWGRPGKRGSMFGRGVPGLMVNGTGGTPHRASLLQDEYRQVRGAFALQLMECWGVRTDRVAVDALEQELTERIDVLNAQLESHGLRREVAQGKVATDLKALRARVEGAYKGSRRSVPRTEKGAVSTTKEVCLESGDPVLVMYGEGSVSRKILTTYIPVIRLGVTEPIHPSFNPLVESGRCSAYRPNLQNPPRLGGVRETFVARPGYLFASCDYDSAELRGLAQVCLDLVGYSQLAQAFQDDALFDPHAAFAADVLGISYEEGMRRKGDRDPEFVAYRQRAKAANFGYPAGLAARTFVSYAKSYGLDLTLEEAEAIRAEWFRKWPEMRDYFRYVSSLVGPTAPNILVQLRSGRARGDVRFTSAANSFFQGLSADGAKRAAFLAAREAYGDPSSPFYGSRPWLLMHDELLVEVPEERAHDAALRLQVLMVRAMEEVTPDVPATASVHLMRRWYKEACPVYNDGRLVPWVPQGAPGG